MTTTATGRKTTGSVSVGRRDQDDPEQQGNGQGERGTDPPFRGRDRVQHQSRPKGSVNPHGRVREAAGEHDHSVEADRNAGAALDRHSVQGDGHQGDHAQHGQRQPRQDRIHLAQAREQVAVADPENGGDDEAEQVGDQGAREIESQLLQARHALRQMDLECGQGGRDRKDAVGQHQQPIIGMPPQMIGQRLLRRQRFGFAHRPSRPAA